MRFTSLRILERCDSLIVSDDGMKSAWVEVYALGRARTHVQCRRLLYSDETIDLWRKLPGGDSDETLYTPDYEEDDE